MHATTATLTITTTITTTTITGCTELLDLNSNESAVVGNRKEHD